MSLRDRHEEFLALSIESRDHYGQDVLFDVGSLSLGWHNNKPGAVTDTGFTLGGLVNVVSDESDMMGDAPGVVTESFNVTVRLSSLLAKCGDGVPAENTIITVTTRRGVKTGVVEHGQTRVDSDLGRVHYFLTEVESVA